ncbi:MAG: glycosyltransferase [Candidatus Cloacimonetes bacterium]|nr:glycosyltransferase [Candidatus Cloacimonadota bacterium]
MKTPKVSVVIGSYNCERFIQETVQSVIDQTFKDWELVIVDDCSTDSTCQKINEIGDDRIRLIKLDKNSGLPAVPRNVAMKNARGDYIAFLDHDDLWLPKKLEKQVEFLEKNKDVFLVYTKCIIQRDGKQLKVNPQKPRSGHIFKDLFLHFNFIDVMTVVIRNKKNANTYFFDEDKKFATVEDYALWLSVAKEQKVSFIDEPLAIYRVHSAGLSKGAFSHFRKCKHVIKKFSPFVSRTMLIRAHSNFYVRLVFVGVMVLLIRMKRAIIR